MKTVDREECGYKSTAWNADKCIIESFATLKIDVYSVKTRIILDSIHYSCIILPRLASLVSAKNLAPCTVQHCTVRYNPVQYSAVQGQNGNLFNKNTDISETNHSYSTNTFLVQCQENLWVLHSIFLWIDISLITVYHFNLTIRQNISQNHQIITDPASSCFFFPMSLGPWNIKRNQKEVSDIVKKTWVLKKVK